MKRAPKYCEVANLWILRHHLTYDAKPECNSRQKRQAAGQLVNIKTLFDSHSPGARNNLESK